MSVFFVHIFLFFFVKENDVTIETRKVMFSGNKLLFGDPVRWNQGYCTDAPQSSLLPYPFHPRGKTV